MTPLLPRYLSLKPLFSSLAFALVFNLSGCLKKSQDGETEAFRAERRGLFGKKAGYLLPYAFWENGQLPSASGGNVTISEKLHQCWYYVEGKPDDLSKESVQDLFRASKEIVTKYPIDSRSLLDMMASDEKLVTLHTGLKRSAARTVGNLAGGTIGGIAAYGAMGAYIAAGGACTQVAGIMLLPPLVPFIPFYAVACPLILGTLAATAGTVVGSAAGDALGDAAGKSLTPPDEIKVQVAHAILADVAQDVQLEWKEIQHLRTALRKKMQSPVKSRELCKSTEQLISQGLLSLPSPGGHAEQTE